MNKALITTALVCATFWLLPASQDAVAAQADGARARVVLQVSDNDPKKWNLALNNARNIAQDLGAENVDIEIVAYGPGIGMLKADSPVASRVTDAVSSKVRIVACENTMHGQKLTEADMNIAVGYVKAGVVELMKRQSEGWAYIRP